MFKEKQIELNRLLQSINRKAVDEEIVFEIQNYDKLKKLKSPDSIHLATANIFNKLINERLLVCSYDRNMIEVSREMGMSVI